MNNRRGKEDEIRETAQGVRWYQKRIAEMAECIRDEKFLRRIYIIISDNIEEKTD